MDGVILNSFTEDDQWKYQAVREAVDELGGKTEKLDKSELDRILGDKGYGECIKACNKYGLSPKKAWTLVAEKTTLARIEKMEEGKFKPYEGVENTLKTLRENNIKTAMISNAPESAVKATMEEFELTQYFKFYRGIENFEDLRDRKPHPNHLEIAKAELKQDPYLYVGDSESDIEAAKNAQMSSVWVRSRDNQISDTPDYTIENISKIKRLLKQ